MTYALQTLTDKVYMGNVVSGVNARDTIAMTEILFGSREAIEETPATI
jgi:trimethylamine--corrinoid protein Co-methyltransferase